MHIKPLDFLRWRFAAAAEHHALKHWRTIAFVLGVLLLLTCALIQVAGAINPHSLWLDDQWVAVLAKHASPGELLELMPPAPLGFLVLLRTATLVIGWGHWQLQLLPLVFGLVQIPLIGCLAWWMTGSRSLGLVAAALLAGSRNFLLFSLRVKQYTLEALIVVALIALAWWCVRRPDRLRFVLVVAAAVAVLPFSFTAVPVGLVIVNVLTLHLVLLSDERRGMARAQVVTLCGGYNVVVLLWLWMLQANQPNDLMFTFWFEHYAPIHDPAAMWAFMQVYVFRMVAGAMPASFNWLAYAVPAAIVLLCWRRQTRLIGLGLLLFYVGMIAVSAMQLYPVGGRRTDLFSYPITIFAVVGALWAVSGTRYTWFLPRLLLLAIAVYMLLFFPGHPTQYPPAGGRDAVQLLNERVQNEDGLILSPKSSWAVGCYGRWPFDLEVAEELTNGFIVEPRRPLTIALRQRWGVREDPARLVAQLDPLLQARPERIYYLSIRPSARSDTWAPQTLEAAGYVSREVPTADGPILVFERVDSVDAVPD